MNQKSIYNTLAINRFKRPLEKGLRLTGRKYKNGKRLEISLRSNIHNENDKTEN